VSTTVTVAVHEASLPEASVAVKVTTVSPRSKNPGASSEMAGVSSHRSVAETPSKKGTSCGSSAGVPPCELHSTTMSAGQTISGGVVSSTVTDTMSVSISRPSSTVRVTTVVPIGNCPVGVAEVGSSKTTPAAVQR